jgi:hypothetical protein
MVSNILSKRHFNLVIWNLLLLILDYVVLFQLEPFFESYVKDYIVLEMQCADIVGAVCIVHNSIINLILCK